MQNVLITGGTGLIGNVLSRQLVAKGYSVTILTRSVSNKLGSNGITYAAWDIEKQTIDEKALQQADHIIHLAGAGVVDRKWTAAYKQEIIDSRTKSSSLIINQLKILPHKVRTIVSASAIGWYGPDASPVKPFTEDAQPATDFLGETCRLWEQSVHEADALQIRTCMIRTGIVLSNEGGALAEFKKPLGFGLAAILGSGKQAISWIHIDDLCRLYIHAIENTAMHGSYNGVAPEVTSNKQLTHALAHTLKRNNFIPIHVPEFMLKLVLGGRSIEVLKSCTVSCQKIKDTGFTFLYPSIEAAMRVLYPVRSSDQHS